MLARGSFKVAVKSQARPSSRPSSSSSLRGLTEAKNKFRNATKLTPTTRFSSSSSFSAPRNYKPSVQRRAIWEKNKPKDAKEVIPKNLKLLINNKWENAADGKTFETINPSTEQVIASVQQAGPKDVDRAVAAARNAFEQGDWSQGKTTGWQRSVLMHRLADLVEKHADELATLESLDNGKPYNESRAVDLPLAIQCLRYYAGWADKIHGKTIQPATPSVMAYTRHEPVGVAAQIIAWNFPLLLASWKLGPALATGCTVVLKPAEQTPLSALRLGELIMEAGFPPGVVNILTGHGEAGSALSHHMDVDKVAFTGSTEVGHNIMEASAKTNLKRVTLELGGKSPNIIFADSELEAAAAGLASGIFFNQGQVCCAGSRVYVEEKVHDQILENAAKVAKKRIVGDPFLKETQQGPQIDKVQFDKILNYVNEGQKAGARIVTGGKRHSDKGYFIQPTIFAEAKDDMKIVNEEIFGPVVSVLKFKDLDDLLARANKSSYGLAAGLWTKDLTKAHYVASKLKAGTVWINTWNHFDATLPFGGFKQSGMGRELGEYALQAYTEVKTVTVQL